MGIIKAICISEKKGTLKMPVQEAELIPNHGIKNDAHAGNWHRQISLLSDEKIQAFKEKVPGIRYGAFGENLVTEGYDLRNIPVGTKFRIGNDIIIQMTQIGKNCHTKCAISKQTGECIMPREGVFARVLKGGVIHTGDSIEELPFDPETPFTAAIITLSDKGFAGEREDKSGPMLAGMVRQHGYEVVEQLLLPDGIERLSAELIRLADQRQVNLILTTGGTGFSQRDLTPEATEKVCQRMAPGIPEAMRYVSLKITPKAMLSRETAGIRNRSLIINLPGSPKAARENLEAVLPALDHGLGILRGTDGECGK